MPNDSERTRTREQRGETPLERYRVSTAESRQHFEEATEYLPGGNSRTGLFYEPYPIYLEAGEGCRVRDVDGNEYLDFNNNHTSQVHGHCHDAVTEAAGDAIRRGSVRGQPTPEEVELARHLTERVAAIETVRFANSGTEATMNAIRAARAYTGNDRIATFEGAYHGTHDDAQVSTDPPLHLAGPADRPESVPDSAGLPSRAAEDAVTLPFNRPDAVEERLDGVCDDLAGVLVAPFMGSQYLRADEEFLRSLDAWTSRHDIPLIFDEVISFRTAHGGVHADYGVEPDLVALGKVIGGGHPVGAFGGRHELMEPFDPRGGARIQHAGTFNANPLTAAAGLAALDALTPEEIERINDLGARAAAGARRALDDHGIDACVNQCGSLFRVYLTDSADTYRETRRSDRELENMVYYELLQEGVHLMPRLKGAVSTPMGEAEVETFVAAFDAALSRLRPAFEARAPGLVE